jgi:mRNA-degrading endonuclease toxin of MazEF toxin-antitoxin module
VVTTTPVASNTDKVYPFQVFVSVASSGLAVDSKAQAEQVRTVTTQRLLRRIGRLSPRELTSARTPCRGRHGDRSRKKRMTETLMNSPAGRLI